MSVDEILNLGQMATLIMVMVSAPPLIAAAGVGLLVGLFQTLTQIQDASLAFVFKIFAVTLVLISVSGWLGAQLWDFTHKVLTDFPIVTR